MNKILLLIISLSLYCCNVAAASLIALSSESGGKMLALSITHNYAKQFLSETKYFTYQQNTSFCGVATATIILNTLNITRPEDKNFGKYKLFTQNNLLTTNDVIKTGFSESTILGHGLTLKEETSLLNAFNGVRATAYSTEFFSEAQAKKIILQSLKSDKSLVIANISRSYMEESGGGHLSPVVAYEAKSDSVLLMDVAAFKQYGPTWVPFHTLYNGMHSKDGNLYRGFIIVTDGTH